MRSSHRKVKILAVIFAVLAAVIAVLLYIYLFLTPKKYIGEVRSASQTYSLEEELVFAVIRVESNFKANAVSRAGACGLMQLMPSTAIFISGGAGYNDLFDVEENIGFGCKYLSYLLRKFPDVEIALAAYNAGEGKVRAWIAEGIELSSLHDIPYGETRNYVKKVKKFYNYYKFFYF